MIVSLNQPDVEASIDAWLEEKRSPMFNGAASGEQPQEKLPRVTMSAANDGFKYNR